MNRTSKERKGEKEERKRKKKKGEGKGKKELGGKRCRREKV